MESLVYNNLVRTIFRQVRSDGMVAQPGERPPHTREVTGSSPVHPSLPFFPEPVRIRGFLVLYGYLQFARSRKLSMIQKHEIPILEYDSDSAEVIRPDHGAEQLVLPEKCVFGFLGDVIDDYARETNAVFGQILYTADSLANVCAHDERDWGKRSLRKALELCINVLRYIPADSYGDGCTFAVQ